MMRRRGFLKCAGAGTLTLGLDRFSWAASSAAGVAGANNDVRLAMVGIGSAEAKGGVGGRGRQLINALRKKSETGLVALGGALIGIGFALLPFGRGFGFAAMTVAVWTMGEILSMPFASTIVAARAGDAVLLVAKTNGANIRWSVVSNDGAALSTV